MRQQEEQHRREHNLRAKEQQERFEQAEREQNALRVAASEVARQRQEELSRELEAAHLRAAELTALTGGVYDPEAPSAEAILRHGPQPLEVFAAEERLPYDPADAQALLPTGLAWGLTCIIGTMTGLSIGLMAHLLEADALMQKPLMALLCIVFGIASAVFGKCAIGYSFRYASERYYLGRPVAVWASFAAIGTATGLTLVLLDAVVERAGLLSIRGLENAVAGLSGGHGSGDSDTWVYLLAALLVTFGYVITAGWEGYKKGRGAAVVNRLQARQRTDFDARDAEMRGRAGVQAALEAISIVVERQRELRELEAEIVAIEAPFVAKLAWLEARRPEWQSELTDTAKRRVEDAVDNFQGCQALFDRHLDHALMQSEPMYGWWERVVRAVLGYQEPTRHDREHRFWTRKNG